MDNAERVSSKEWRWCLVGNIVEEHIYGEDHEIVSGSRQFPPGAKVYIELVYGGMGHEKITVIGLPRHSKKYIEIVIPRRYVCNFRVQQVYKPAVLERMKRSPYRWWGDTEEIRKEIESHLERFNAAAEENKNILNEYKNKK